MAASVATAVLLTRRTQRSLALTPFQKLALGLGAFCGGMIGAKLPFVLSDWDGLLSGWAWLDSGKTLLFGLVGGYFGVEVAKRIADIRVKTGDSFAVPVAAAVAVGRFSCFAGGCCYGTPTTLSWGVDFGDGLRRHPTQLYEAAFHALAAVVLLECGRRGWFAGQRIKLYILAYLVYRFLSEFLRPEPALFRGWSGYQWASLALIPVFVLLWVRDARPIGKEAGC